MAQADGSREAARAPAKSSVKSPIHVRGGRERSPTRPRKPNAARWGRFRTSARNRAGSRGRPTSGPRARAEARSPASGEPCAARRVAASAPRASTAPPGSSSPRASAGRGRRGLQGRLGEARQGEEPRGGRRTGRAVEERPGEAAGRRVEPQLVEGAGERLLQVPGEEPFGDLGPLPDDPVDARPVDGRDELGELEREGLVGERNVPAVRTGRDRLGDRRESPRRSVGRGSREEGPGRDAPEPGGGTAFDPLPKLLQDRLARVGTEGPEEERNRLRRLQRRRLAVRDATEPLEGAVRVLDGPLEIPRAGAPGRSASSAQSAPVARGPSRSRRRSCSTTRAAAAGSEPSSSGITVREISVKWSSNRADSLPSRPRSPPSGSGKTSFQGPSATDRRSRPASSTTSATASGSPWSPSSPHGAVRMETRRTPSAWGRTRRARPSPQASRGSGTIEDARAVEAHGGVAPRPGEEGRDAARAGEEPWPRRAPDPLFHRRLGDRPERRLPVGRDADDTPPSPAPAEEPRLVAEERGLGAAQRGRRDGGADRPVGEPEDVPRLHLPLLAGAGQAAAEAVGGRRGDAGARVGDAQDVPLVAEREDGPLRALGVAQDEPAGQGLDGPDEPPRRHAEGRLEPAPRRRRRGRAERREREERRRAEAERGESADAERGGRIDTGGRQHRRRGAPRPHSPSARAALRRDALNWTSAGTPADEEAPVPENNAIAALAKEGIEVLGPIGPQYDEILTPEALRFVASLQRTFGARREELLARRVEAQKKIDSGVLPDFLPETEEIRKGDWKVAPIPPGLEDRRVEITGPVDRKMVINALNSGASVFLADFEDANSPTWANCVEGQRNLRDAIDGTIDYRAPETGKEYRLNEKTAILLVRPRGWHLLEKHLLVDGKPCSGSLFDFGLYFFHCGKTAPREGGVALLLPPEARAPPRGAPLERRLREGAEGPRHPERDDPRDRPHRDDHGRLPDGRDPLGAEGPLGGPQLRPLGLHLLVHQEARAPPRLPPPRPRPRDDGEALPRLLRHAPHPHLPPPRHPRDGRHGGADPDQERPRGERGGAREGAGRQAARGDGRARRDVGGPPGPRPDRDGDLRRGHAAAEPDRDGDADAPRSPRRTSSRSPRGRSPRRGSART